jgi:hypothetical protein
MSFCETDVFFICFDLFQTRAEDFSCFRFNFTLRLWGSVRGRITFFPFARSPSWYFFPEMWFEYLRDRVLLSVPLQDDIQSDLNTHPSPRNLGQIYIPQNSPLKNSMTSSPWGDPGGQGIQIWRPVNGNSFCNVCVRDMEILGFADADNGTMLDLEAKSRLR